MFHICRVTTTTTITTTAIAIAISDNVFCPDSIRVVGALIQSVNRLLYIVFLQLGSTLGGSYLFVSDVFFSLINFKFFEGTLNIAG